ncbi:HlyD family type I secretion periplasmic adaptor subunit [Lysobacter antibioticus]|uniref:HlyD family type I secretion periplasmic adaptor subunit n=1 Tax=Lysobacter antibioticus TaxID=84531 RepID=UPI00071752C9|nr:HlyD family type I secretion periplasmic adaptor subunit [Lysobacter antibioticus]
MLLDRVKSVLKTACPAGRTVSGPNKTRDEHEFQPGYLEVIERPPAPWSRRTAVALAATFAAVLVWAIFGHLDIQANASGRLLVPSNSKVVQSVEGGEIAAIHVRDGARVEVGDVLVSLNPIGADAEFRELRGQLNFKLLEQARLQALLTDDPVANFIAPEDASAEHVAIAREHLLSISRELRANIAGIESEMAVNRANQNGREADIAALQKLATNVMQRLDAYRVLAAGKLISNVELQQQERERLEIERAVSQQRSELGVMRAQYQLLAHQRSAYLAKTAKEYQDSLASVRVEVSNLAQKLVRAKEKVRLQTLRATVGGVVQQLAVHTRGGAVQAGQQLMVIVPNEKSLQAEVMVLNGDVGFVRPGQSVELKIDSFAYTRYGTVPGKILNVSRDAVKDDRLGLVFPARVELRRLHMASDGKTFPLQAGMGLSAEIRTGRRRVIDYVLGPLREYQSEALKER